MPDPETVPPEAITAAVEALKTRSAQSPGSKGEAATRWHAVVALEAAAPLLAAQALRDATREQFEDAIRAGADEVIHARLAEIEQASRAAERERIFSQPVSQRFELDDCLLHCAGCQAPLIDSTMTHKAGCSEMRLGDA